MINHLRKNLKKQVKLTMFSQMIREKQITIRLVMPLLKEGVVVKDLEDLISIPLLFQTYSKIFLEISVLVVRQEDLVTEEMI